MVNIDPPEELPEHWHSDFRGEYRSCIVEHFSEFDEENYRGDLRDSISTEKEHRKLINMCVFPFSPMGDPPAGYRFIQADPLSELGVKNFDFLLYDFDGHAIFGEAKSRIPQQPDRIVNQIIEQREVVQKKLDYIAGNYTGEKLAPDAIEYVLATYVDSADRVTREIMSRGEEVITWAADQYSDSISVNEAIPDSLPDDFSGDSLDEQLQELRLRVNHNVAALNSSLSRADTATEVYDVFPESSSLDLLRTVISACKSERRYNYVNRSDIRQVLIDDLFYLEEKEVGDLVDQVIEDGTEIGLLEDWNDERGDYKVVSRYSSSNGIEQTLERKWIDSRIEERKDEMRDFCYDQAREKFARQSQFDEFF